ncbi:MAG: peptidylprolyl isomerase [Bryobacteraceae bacterium]
MFDLFRSRDKVIKYMLSGFLLIVAFSMIGYLIPGYGGAPISGSDNVIAEIGGERLTDLEVRKSIQAGIRGRQFPPEMIPFYAPQVIEQMISERVLEYQAEKMGFRVTDEQTANAIRETLPQLFQEGKFIGNDAYAAMLAQQDLTIPEFERYMARQLKLNRIRNLVAQSVVVTQADIENEFRKRNEKATIEYVRIAPETVKSSVTVTEQEIADYYGKNKTTFQVPEKRALKLLVLDPAKVEASVQVPDDRLQRAYTQDKDRFRMPDRAMARHILLGTTGKTPEEEAKIKAKAEELLKKVKSGGDFTALAKANSDDPGSKPKGGDLGWILKGQMVPEFEAMVFSLKPGQIGELVKTQYGYHIVQVQQRENARLKPFEEVKGELLAEVRKQVVADQIANTVENAGRDWRKTPQAWAEIAKKYDLTVADVEKAGRGEPLPEIGVNKDFEEAVFTLKKGQVSGAFQAPGDRQVIAMVTDIIPPSLASLEDSKNKIRDYLTNDRSKTLAKSRAAEFEAKVKALGDLKKAAQAMKLDVKTSPEFARVGAVEGLGSAESVPEAFSKPVGTAFGPTQIGDAYIIGRVASRKDAEMVNLIAQIKAIREELKAKKVREREGLFEEGLRKELEAKGTLKVNQDVVKRIVASFRG